MATTAPTRLCMLVGLGALSALSANAGVKLSPAQIYQTAKGAGFPPDVAVQMTAIALRESAGWTGSVYTGRTGSEEYSTGLWQINTKDSGIRNLLAANGITPDQLVDPNVNARAAYLLWGGNPNNLNVAWYINRPGYSEGYQANLPIAEAAAESVEGAGFAGATGGADIMSSIVGGGGGGSGSSDEGGGDSGFRPLVADESTVSSANWGVPVLVAVAVLAAMQIGDT